ncbi:hypothetical protein HYZ05_02115 [Candidatus Daviesbacteria bacterium]|nr:hypothetical protein [Candidatus Daviesbacteria bacterium]
MEILSIIPATVLGYATFRATTHPASRIRRKLPNFKVKRVQFFPVIRINMFGRAIHFHHWFNFSILLALSGITSVTVLDHMITRGLLIGGIIQGLTLPRGYKNVFSCKCSHCLN